MPTGWSPQHAPAVVELLDTLGRVLAEPILADRDQPPFPRSTRDGFACRAADVAAGLPLEVIGSIRAGDAVVIEVSAGKAVEIMTGAPVPAGADCVVMVEHVERDRDTLRLAPAAASQPGENIVPMGAEARAGAVIVPRGTRISPAQVAVAAACGAGKLSVFGRPRVAIVATGDELVEVNQQPQSHQIRNSNSYSLAAQVLAAGAEPVRLPIARDERGHLEGIDPQRAGDRPVSAFGRGFHGQVRPGGGGSALPGGGVLFYRRADPAGQAGGLRKAWGTLLFRTSRQSCVDHGYVLAFCRAAFWARFAGRWDAAPFRPGSPGERGAGEDWPDSFFAGTVDGWNVEPVTWQGSGDLASTSRSNCFLVVPPDQPVLAAGETVTILLA